MTRVFVITMASVNDLMLLHLAKYQTSSPSNRSPAILERASCAFSSLTPLPVTKDIDDSFLEGLSCRAGNADLWADPCPRPGTGRSALLGAGLPVLNDVEG